MNEESGSSPGADEDDDSRADSTVSGGPDRAALNRLAAGTKLRYLGDYEILEEIDRGGMGVVYRARQTSLDRLVALKVILEGEFASEAAVRRFRREAEAAAQIDHPNIVPIYEVGEHEGTQYFSMKLVEGASLRELAKSYMEKPRQTAELMAKMARAVDHAHRCGVVHRDLKPGNVLIDSAGEPHVTDFGLARRFTDPALLAISTTIAGTPSYMAPEQASGTPVVTTAVDVYALGAILYELVAGQPPFSGDSVLETLRHVAEDEPRRPSQIRRGVERDLEAIALRCMQKRPEARYRTAGDVADDLERFLKGEPTHARPITWRYRSEKWLLRHRAGVALSALAIVLIAKAAKNEGVTPYPPLREHRDTYTESTRSPGQSCRPGTYVGRNAVSRPRRACRRSVPRQVPGSSRSSSRLRSRGRGDRRRSCPSRRAPDAAKHRSRAPHRRRDPRPAGEAGGPGGWLGKELAPADVQSVVTWLGSLTGEIPTRYIAFPQQPK